MFKSMNEVAQDVGEALTYALDGIQALDVERGLCLTTTDGRTRNARRWFVHRYAISKSPRKDYSDRVSFRAWDVAEAIDKCNADTRTMNRIAQLVKEVRNDE